MPLRKITLENNIPLVNLCEEDLERLKISETTRIYLMTKGEDGIIFILHSVGPERTESGEYKFYWLGLNNSIVWTSVRRNSHLKNEDYFTSVESALGAALEAGYKVFQHNGDLFDFLREQMKEK